MKLKEIAEIRIGRVTRKNSEALLDNSSLIAYKVLTVAGINDNFGEINPDKLDDYFSTDAINSEHLCKKNDLVVRLSHPNTCIIVDENCDNLLISNLFAVIRLINNEFIPEYIWMLINNGLLKPIAKTKGLIATVNKSQLEEVEINPISIDKQQQLSTIYRKSIALRKSLLAQAELEEQYINLFIKEQTLQRKEQ